MCPPPQKKKFSNPVLRSNWIDIDSVSDDYDWVDRRPHRPEPCNLCSSFCSNNNDNDAKDMFKNLVKKLFFIITLEAA